jgi:N-hydroxyarylamine O-acetyltransferase
MTDVEPLPPDLVAAYLELLGVDARPGTIDADALRALQRAHVERVVYETVDIVMGRPPGIDPVASARRLVNGRGGYCYHLNGAFSCLLASLGVDVTRHVAGVQGRGQEAPGANGNHLGLTVRTPDGREWLVDVGLGDGPLEPLPLVQGEHEQHGYRYRLGPSALGGDMWRFEHDVSGSFEGFEVASKTAVIGDFEAMHAKLSTESGFARTVTAQRRTGIRLEILRGCTFTEISPGTVQTSEVTEPDAWWDLVIGHYRLAYDDLSRDERHALWQRVRTDHEAWRAAGSA